MSKKPGKAETSDPEKTYLSIRAYCAHRKALNLPYSVSTVQLALASGRIWRSCHTHEKCPAGCRAGGIDPTVADVSWEESTDVRRTSRDHATPPTFLEAQAALTDARARNEELKYLREIRRLVVREEADAQYFEALRGVRTALLALPRKIAGRLAVMDDAREVQKALDVAIREVLDGIRTRLAS